MALFFDHFLRHSFLYSLASLASLMPCLSFLSCLLLLYATTKMQVMCCGAVCFAISPHNTYLQGELGRYTPSPPWPSHTPSLTSIISCMTKPIGESKALPSLAKPAHPSQNLLCVWAYGSHTLRGCHTPSQVLYTCGTGAGSWAELPPCEGGKSLIQALYLRTLYAV